MRTAVFGALIYSSYAFTTHPRICNNRIQFSLSESEWTSDFDDFEDEDSLSFAQLYQNKGPPDKTAIRRRQLSLGEDLILESFVGNMGFDEVTDWEYYYQDEEDPDNRNVVQPNPFDKSKPKRTRTSSGSVIRIFRAELVGQIGGMISSQGRDRRVLVKEYTGELALKLAQSELECVGDLQSDLVKDGEDWSKAASARSVLLRQDNSNLSSLVQKLKQSPYLGILGEVNLAELDENLEPNEFYRALGVAPPKPEAVWVVYEYAGLTSLQAYCRPMEDRRRQLPPTKGFFGNPIPPEPLPCWEDRADYIIKGVMKQSLVALANLHEHGMVHRSIGRSSLLLASRNTMDPRDASSVYTTNPQALTMKLTDFGFAGPYNAVSNELKARARTFGLTNLDGSVATVNFALAEDFHALGFVFLGLLLTTLAEVPPDDPAATIPATDEDTLQRLLSEIFSKDVRGEFREYLEAEDCWSNLVAKLDKADGAGWSFLESLLLAREKAASKPDTDQIFSIRGLLTNPLFQ